MYINDINIIAYVIVALLGAVAGQICDLLNFILPKHKKILSIENTKKYLKSTKPKYLLMVIHIIIYLGILYRYGINDVNTIKYMILTPMIISAFYIDYKMQIIPNRLTLTMFEFGLIFTALGVITNINTGINVFINNILGMLVGAGIFLLITLIGGLIAGKEAMGFGDVKLMGALGLYFGWVYIIMISVMAFLFAAIVSIGILIFKRKKVDEYIPFGPFIVTSSIICIYVPFYILFTTLLKVFSLGMI